MRATPIVVRDPLGQDRPQMSFMERNDVVETFSARRPDQALAERVGVSRQLHRRRAVRRKPFGLLIPSIRCVGGPSK